MAVITVDGKELEVDDDANLLDACLSHALDLPYFCWHPALGSVGSCRQCAVRVYADEQDERGRIMMSCMTPVRDGMILSIDEPGAQKFRDQSIEVTMANHPHDCPVCEEGGECHLQDMTIMSHHTSRRYRGRKKTYQNQYLGPCIGHEMNRCIACYRCVRFYNDYAGGKDLAVFSLRENVYFGRHEEGTLESVFSGNLVEVCPTGVFTDKTLARSYTRKWDLQSAPSICEGCSVGCNTAPNERYGKIKRIVNRYHYDVNGYFLCDKGRFGYDHINHAERVRQAHCRDGDALQPVDYEEAIAAAAKRIADSGPGNVLGIGSGRASVEENALLQELLGQECFSTGLSESQQEIHREILRIGRDPRVHIPSLRDIESCDAVLVLGEDLLNTAPRMALSVRQATRNLGFEMAKKTGIPLWQDDSVRILAQDQRSPLIIASVAGTELDEIASATLQATPAGLAQFGFAVAHALDHSCPLPPRFDEQLNKAAKSAADVLSKAKNPAILSGAGLNSPELVKAAAQIAFALAQRTQRQKINLAYVLPQANSMGLALLTNESGCDLDQIFATVTGNPGQYSLVVLQQDLFQTLGAERAEKLLGACKSLIVLEQHHNATAKKADVLLPAEAVVETEGTFVNYEGRAQRFFEVFAADTEQMKDNWKTLINIDRALANDAVEHQRESRSEPHWQRIANINVFDDVVDMLVARGGDFEKWHDIAPDAKLRIANMRVPRQPHRYSGRTSINANRQVAELQPPQDEDSPLAYSMEGAPINVPSSLSALIWAPRWNSNEAINKFQDEIGGHWKGGDSGVLVIQSASQNLPIYDPKAEAIPLAGKQLLAVSAARVFDADRREAMSAALTQRAGRACLQMHSSTAAQLGLEEGKTGTLKLNGSSVNLPVRINDRVAAHTVMVPNDVATQQHIPSTALPAAVELEV